MEINKQYKKYLLGRIYEEIEKSYFNAFHSKDQENIKKYKNWLNEINNKKIKNIQLIATLKNMQESYATRLPELKEFIFNLLDGTWENDPDFDGHAKDFLKLY